MGRKITHTKRGTYYNGPTGRRKVSNPLGALFSAAGSISKTSRSSKNRKSSASYSSSFTSYSGNSNDRNSTAGCIFVSIVALLIVIFEGFLLSKCSGNHSGRKKDKRWQHPERYRPRNNIIIENIADPWHCLNIIVL